MSDVWCAVVLGRQGSGKGEQSARLARRFGLDHVSTGALLREAIADGTPLGRAVEAVVDAGGLVPDDLVTGVVAERLALAEIEGRGVVLDGFPRTVHQVGRLAGLLAPGGIDVAVHLDVPRAVAVERLLRRTDGRSDDTPAAIGRRMSEHAARIGPLLDRLSRVTTVVHVDGVAAPDVVEDRIARAVGAVQPTAAAATTRCSGIGRILPSSTASPTASTRPSPVTVQ